MNLIKSGSRIFAVKIVVSVVSFVGVAYFSRELGAAQIGIFFLFQSVITTISIPADFGLTKATEKRISEGTDSADILTTAIIGKLGIILVPSIFVVIFRGQLNNYIGASLWGLLIAYLFIKEFNNIILFTLRGELKVELAAYLRAFSKISWILFGGGFILVGLGYFGLVYGLMLAGAITSLVGLYLKSTSFGKGISIKHFHSLVDFSKYSFINSIGGYSYSWIDIIVIGFFLESQFVGAYEIAWRVAAVTVLVSESLSSLILPQISRLEVEDNLEEIEQIVSDVLLFAVLIPIPAFFGTTILSEEILVNIFGSEFGVAAVVLIILMFEKIPQSIDQILVHTLQGLDRPDLAAYPLIIATALNVALNIILIKKFGITGAALATTLAYLVNVLLHWRFVNSKLSINIPAYEIGWIFSSGVIMLIIVYLAKQLLYIRASLQLAVLIMLGIVSYFVLVMCNRRIRNELTSVIG